MEQFWQFMRVYGALIGCAALIIGFVWLIAYVVSFMRRLDARVDAIQAMLNERFDKLNSDAREDARKQRRMLSESLVNLSETMTRAIIKRGLPPDDAQSRAKRE